MKSDVESVLKQFEPIEQKHQELLKKVPHRNLLDLPSEEVIAFQTMCLSCISRVAGASGGYAQQAEAIQKRYNYYYPYNALEIYGIIQGLKSDVSSGHLSTWRELVHADLFSDFLDSAAHLLHEGYKDSAAVMIGGVLEEHLRKLCLKWSISLEFENHKEEMKPKKATTLNEDLCKASVYGANTQKQVVAWQGIRNNAAHCEYKEYTIEEVRLFLQGLRDFIERYPA